MTARHYFHHFVAVTKWVLHLLVTAMVMKNLGIVVSGGSFYTVTTMENKINRLIYRCHSSVNELIERHVCNYFCIFAPKFWEGAG